MPTLHSSESRRPWLLPIVLLALVTIATILFLTRGSSPSATEEQQRFFDACRLAVQESLRVEPSAFGDKTARDVQGGPEEYSLEGRLPSDESTRTYLCSGTPEQIDLATFRTD